MRISLQPLGKMVATRGEGTLSQGMREEHQMQFMPTPTVARGSATGTLQSGPIATLVDQLQHIDDVEFLTIRKERTRNRQLQNTLVATSLRSSCSGKQPD